MWKPKTRQDEMAKLESESIIVKVTQVESIEKQMQNVKLVCESESYAGENIADKMRGQIRKLKYYCCPGKKNYQELFFRSRKTVQNSSSEKKEKF